MVEEHFLCSWGCWLGREWSRTQEAPSTAGVGQGFARGRSRSPVLASSAVGPTSAPAEEGPTPSAATTDSLRRLLGTASAAMGNCLKSPTADDVSLLRDAGPGGGSSSGGGSSNSNSAEGLEAAAAGAVQQVDHIQQVQSNLI